ncbi:MAG: phosphate/phosphite/phosphonate ABC transporter substrate-binding protein [Rhizobacter sp.]|nr:phosphate/phosphite/phosphonate ABC transporter substrate-binding protein [Rhizobacter sp.]
MIRRRHWVAGLALGPGMWCSVPAHGAPVTAAPPVRGFDGPLVVALIAPSQAPDEVRAKWRLLADKLARRLGTAVELQVSSQYADVVKAAISGRAHVTWLSNASALEAVESGGAEVFATMQVRGPDGQALTGYRSQIVVRDDSPLRGVEDLLARASRLSLRMGDMKSTSGYIIPFYYVFARRGLNPAGLFKSMAIGGHADNMAAVLRGEADASTTNDEEVKKLAQRDPEGARRLRVIWSSQEIRQSPLLWSAALSPLVRAAIRETVLGFGQNTAEQQALMDMNRIVKFVPSSNRQLLPIADIDLFTARSTLAADKTLSPEQKAAAEAQINHRATRLEVLLKRS